MLWLSYYYVQIRLASALAHELLLKTILETSFLLVTVVWGTVAWDSYKDISDASVGKHLASELAAFTQHLTVALPIFVAGFDFVVN